MSEIYDPNQEVTPATPENKEGIIKKILVVDDDDLVLAGVIVTLEMEGYETVSATSAEEALNKLSEVGDIDAVLTDNDMSVEMSGIELLQRIRTNSDPRFKKMPIILHTGRHSEETEQTVKNLQGAYLEKPYGTEDLKKALETAKERAAQ